MASVYYYQQPLVAMATASESIAATAITEAPFMQRTSAVLSE